MRRLLPLLLLVGGCQWTAVGFGYQGGLAACVLAGIDAEGKTVAEVSALGAGSVRESSCSGEAVPARMQVQVRQWHDVGPTDVLCSTAFSQTWSDELVTALATMDNPSNLCDEPDEYGGGTWYAEAKVVAWIEGVEHESPWVESPREPR
jgi:hypothetical protein